MNKLNTSLIILFLEHSVDISLNHIKNIFDSFLEFSYLVSSFSLLNLLLKLEHIHHKLIIMYSCLLVNINAS